MKPAPCPFCGKVPKLHPVHPDREGDAWGAVRCENMRCQTFDEVKGFGVTVRDGVTVSDTRGSDRYKQAAIRRWNKRNG